MTNLDYAREMNQTLRCLFAAGPVPPEVRKQMISRQLERVAKENWPVLLGIEPSEFERKYRVSLPARVNPVGTNPRTLSPEALEKRRARMQEINEKRALTRAKKAELSRDRIKRRLHDKGLSEVLEDQQLAKAVFDV